MQKTPSFKRFLPFLILFLLLTLSYCLGLTDYLSFSFFQKKRAFLTEYLELHPFLFPALFILLYLTATAISFPGASLLTILGGFFFGQPLGTIYSLMGATIGASLIFLAAKTAFSELLKKKSGPMLKKVELGFQKNAISYLLFLRLVPLFPFWFVNLAPAFFNIPFRSYLWTTLLGILPGTFVYTQAGRGLSSILDLQEDFSVKQLLTEDMQIAIYAFAGLSLLPFVLKFFFSKKFTSKKSN